MEALVGQALFTAGGSAVGTTGLFGVAGSFAPTLGSVAGFMGGTGGSLLSLGLTGASAFGQIAAGNSSASILNLQAQQAELNARMQGIKGREEALTIKRQLDKDLASQNALFSARGVLQGEGSALAASKTAKANAKADLEVAQFGAEMGSESDKLRASQYRTEAKVARKSGRTEALNTIAGSRTVQNFGYSLLGGI